MGNHKQVVVNVEVKPSRLLSVCSFLPRATLRLPPVTYIGKPMCIAFQASLSCSLYLSGEPLIPWCNESQTKVYFGFYVSLTEFLFNASQVKVYNASQTEVFNASQVKVFNASQVKVYYVYCLPVFWEAWAPLLGWIVQTVESHTLVKAGQATPTSSAQTTGRGLSRFIF